jgi:DNA polymerase-4
MAQLAQADPARVEMQLGSWGRAMAALARGEDPREVESLRAPHSYGEENTFPEDESDPSRLEETLRRHAEAVARRLRRDGVVGHTVVLKLKLARRREAGPRGYPQHTRQRMLGEATDDGGRIAEVARTLLREFSLQEPVRLLGVTVRGIGARGAGQLSLFEAEGVEARRDLHTAMDAINARFGRGAVSFGGDAAHAEATTRAGLHDRAKSGEDSD